MRTQRQSDAVVGLVIPCFNEEEVIPAMLSALESFSRNCPHPVKVLFVDDGSSDETRSLLAEACRQDAAFACVNLSRNFGHQNAVSAGLAHVDADVVAVMDADLQDPPEVILEMLSKWRDGYDVVYGVRQDRKEGLLLRAAYKTFYFLLSKIANVQIPPDAGDFCVMDRRVVDAIRHLPERARFVRGLRGWVGFRQVGLPYRRHARAAGRPKYSLIRLTNLALDGLIGFSWVPLRLSSWIGLLACSLGLILGIWALVGALYLRQTPPGWASLAVIVLFFSGVQLLVLGIIGEYVGRILEETKGRPPFIVESAEGWVLERRDAR